MSEPSNYYQILGISSDANEAQIKEAYLFKANLLHPDRLNGMSEGVQKKAEDEVKAINETYSTLSNTILREQYDLRILGRSESSFRKGRPLSPEVLPKVVKVIEVVPHKKVLFS